MYKKINLFVLLLLFFSISSCSNGLPSEILLQSDIYSKVETNKSSGGKFDIVRYSNGKNELALIVPYETLDTGLDDFAEVYTLTFSSKGYVISNNGNRYLGVSDSQVVYLTPSPELKVLSILLRARGDGEEPVIDESSDIFQAMNDLR